jgi:hypothetical protein
MVVGDRVVLQKDTKGFKSGSVGTLVEFDKVAVIRVRGIYFGAEKNVIRKATKNEILEVPTVDVVHDRFWSGAVYIVANKNIGIDDLQEGDKSFIAGVVVEENENDDIFCLDFGNKKLKLNKRFIEDNMNLIPTMSENYIDETENKESEGIYMEKNKNNDDNFETLIDAFEKEEDGDEMDVVIKSLSIGEYEFELDESEIMLPSSISKNNLENYILALKKLKKFLKNSL